MVARSKKNYIHSHLASAPHQDVYVFRQKLTKYNLKTISIVCTRDDYCLPGVLYN